MRWHDDLPKEDQFCIHDSINGKFKVGSSADVIVVWQIKEAPCGSLESFVQKLWQRSQQVMGDMIDKTEPGDNGTTICGISSIWLELVSQVQHLARIIFFHVVTNETTKVFPNATKLSRETMSKDSPQDSIKGPSRQPPQDIPLFPGLVQPNYPMPSREEFNAGLPTGKGT